MSINVKETATASENEVNEGNASKEVRNEENAIVDTEKGRNGIEEEKNEETAMEEEKYEDSTMEPNEIVEEGNEQNATEQEEEVEEEEAEEKEEEDEDEEEKEENEKNTTEQGKNKEKVGVNSGEKDTRSRKRRRKKKVALRGSETVATKAENNPGSSSKKKVSKRAESTGMIFMCSSKTKEDCYRYKVLGLPASKRDIVQKVYKGMRLFLFDFDLRLMYGIYKAAQPGGYNIEPKAFKSAFPSQVRFTVLEDCLPLAEEKFKTVIKDNYYKRNKFNCELTSEQVKNLCKLFTASSRRFKSKELGRNRRAENRKYLDRDRIRRRSLDEERRSVLVADSRYHDRPIMYEREMFASTVAPLPRLPPLPPPRAPAPLNYASYGRTLDMDVYRRDPLVERSDLRLLDLEARLLDETGSHDPYISYRAYRDPLYSTGLPPEYNPPAGLRPEYRHPPGAPLDYRHTAEAPSEYGPRRPLYRY